MQRLIRKQDIPYIVITILFGSLNFFLYRLSGQHPVAALFTPVRNSVWEYLKLLFFPVLLLSILEYLFRAPKPGIFFGGRFAGVWTGMLLVTVLHYGYSGILGMQCAAASVFLFLFGIVIIFFLSRKLGRYFRRIRPLNIFFCWTISVLLFFFFTCFPPELPIFLPLDF